MRVKSGMQWAEYSARVAVGPKCGDPWQEDLHDLANKRRWFIRGDVALGIWGCEILIGWSSRLTPGLLPKLKATQALTANNLTLYRESFREKDKAWWVMDSPELPVTEEFIHTYVNALPVAPLPETGPLQASMYLKTGSFDDKWGYGTGIDERGTFDFILTDGVENRAYRP